MFGKAKSETLPPPGPKLEGILCLRPKRDRESRIVRENKAGALIEWAPEGQRAMQFHLDPMGAEVYKAIDGKKTLAEYVEGFAAEHQLTFFESCALWVAYTRTLTQRNILELETPEHT
jgi:hypothetical protein